ncbi:hypothetical protein [Falsibacillus albus]|uniref:Uncharacterized protein n=1 Tax=Falsibacillus albus TaxID=2478915 RepID=A0A3L7JZT4_9BACI|nr:hypothetical protein [Falsibacillus albus]RLQ96297.1 hypothetical protein D9X91_08415 [Falsibacillus albus]
MDRVSCIAYLLFQSEQTRIRKLAINLVTGEISLNAAKKIADFYPHIVSAEKQLKRTYVSQEEVCEFVETYLFTAQA